MGDGTKTTSMEECGKYGRTSRKVFLGLACSFALISAAIVYFATHGEVKDLPPHLDTASDYKVEKEHVDKWRGLGALLDERGGSNGNIRYARLNGRWVLCSVTTGDKTMVLFSHGREHEQGLEDMGRTDWGWEDYE